MDTINFQQTMWHRDYLPYTYVVVLAGGQSAGVGGGEEVGAIVATHL